MVKPFEFKLVGCRSGLTVSNGQAELPQACYGYMGNGRLYTVRPAVAGFRIDINNGQGSARVTFGYAAGRKPARRMEIGNPAAPVFSAHRQLDALGRVSGLGP